MSEYDKATIIFPHQLFSEHPGLNKDYKVYLVEEQLFFFDPEYKIPFHKKKILLHRASMKAYFDFLTGLEYDVDYINYEPDPKMGYIFEKLKEDYISKIIFCDPVDYALSKRINLNSKDIKIQQIDSLSFLNSENDIINLETHRSTSFYISQRKKLDILLKDGKPVGKKWTYDKYNRKKLPPDIKTPEITPCPPNNYVKKAAKYVNKYFPKHPGLTDGFIYPVTHVEAKKWFELFLKERFHHFGEYQDAISHNKPFVYHSLISSSLNIGLLIPQQVLEMVLRKNDIPLNSLEGFIRQIIGWREFLRAVYVNDGVKQRRSNFWGFKKEMPWQLWMGKTGLKPYDETVRRVYTNAYAHHIERLMILGNLMLLMSVNPDQVYRWFMSLFIDAYDWVMVPNVYGMSQYADGGLITTKPYISSSNYLKK